LPADGALVSVNGDGEPRETRVDGIGGVDDDLAGEAVGVLDEQRLGRDPGCGQDYHLGPDERLGDAPDIALGVAGRVARSVNHRVTLRPQGASEGLPDITRADNGDLHWPPSFLPIPGDPPLA